ncbi:MAG: hypothetical protein JOZ24_05455 [Candidatus Eremiobacteraeota bacterium]|nr:hypothetical protein [Candidatus Eremiobacteraeota bacterium]
MIRRSLAFALISTATLLSGCAGGGGSLPQATPTAVAPSSNDRELTSITPFLARNDATGETVRTFPTREIADAYRASGGRATQAHNASTNGALQYYGGPVAVTPKIYVIFWGSKWNSSSGDPYGVKNRLTSFEGAIGGSAWLNTVTQYYQSGPTYIGNSGSVLAGTWVDTGSTPPSRPSQNAMATEAFRAANSQFHDYSWNASYVIAMPHGVRPSGFGTQYCAYHSTASSGGHTIAWTNLPYMPDAGYSCGAGSVNSPGTTDGVTIVGGHEQAETETDPGAGNGWLDSSGNEIGDLCAWTNLQNTQFGSTTYPTQPLYSDASASCVQHYP